MIKNTQTHTHADCIKNINKDENCFILLAGLQNSLESIQFVISWRLHGPLCGDFSAYETFHAEQQNQRVGPNIYTGNKGRTLKFKSYINHLARSLAVVHLSMAFTHKRPVGFVNWIHVSTDCSTNSNSFCPPVQWVDYELFPQEIATELCGTRYSFWTRMAHLGSGQLLDARDRRSKYLHRSAGVVGAGHRSGLF